MKILFLNEYAPSRAVSGAEFSMMALAEGLRLSGQTVSILTPEWKKNQPGEGLSPLWFNNPIYFIYSAWQIFRAVKKYRTDLIHVHGKYILPGAVIAGWLTRKPVVATMRDFKFLCPLALCFTHQQKKCGFSYYINKEIPEYHQRYGQTAKWKLTLAKLWQYKLKWFLNHCQQIITVSPQLAKIYQDNGVKKVVSIYNLPPEKQKVSTNRQNIILSVGKLSYGKGTDCLIKAAEQLPQYQFIFAGSLNSSFKLKFPHNCQYLGKVSHDQALKLYKEAGVFAILSRWPEPLSRAGLEALSFGLPIVASDRGGNKELVKDNGYLVDPEKPNAVTQAIVKVINNQTLLSQKSLDLLRTRFNRHKILESHLNLYKKIIKL